MEANNCRSCYGLVPLRPGLKIIQDLTVGPLLGQGLDRKGVKGDALCGSLVVVFMALYYRLSGGSRILR